MDNTLHLDKVGRFSGLVYVILMYLGIPIMIFNDPGFSTDLSNFDPLSKLSTTETSRVYYRFLHIIAGFTALLFFELHFFRERRAYWKLNSWYFSKFTARMGAIGQISTGIFERNVFPLHLFAAAAFATGFVSCFVFISFNLDNQLMQKGNYAILIVLGYIISILVLFNSIYFRYSNIRGIWQFFIILISIGWYILEFVFYHAYKSNLEKNVIEGLGTPKIRPISYIMIGFGLYLLIFAFLLHTRPRMWPWECTEDDETCQLPNVITLIVAGTIVTLYAGVYQRRMRKKIHEFQNM